MAVAEKPKRTSQTWQHSVMRTLSYGTKVALASEAAAKGYGYEDLVVKYGINPEIAKAIVFTRKK